jgi:hypothetical protein
VDCKFDQNTDVVAVAKAIVGSCAAYRLGRYDFHPERRAKWEAVAQAHFVASVLTVNR